MPNCQSAEISPVASTRSRSTMDSKFSISYRDVASAFSQSFFSHCFKVMLRSLYKDFLACNYMCDKMVLFLPSLIVFGWRQDMGIDFSSGQFRAFSQKAGELSKADISDHHKVNVTVCLLLPRCKRSEHKRTCNVLTTQRFPEQCRETGRLVDQLSNGWIQWMGPVGFVVAAVSIPMTVEKADVHQVFQFLPDAGFCKTGLAGQFSGVKLSVFKPK